MVAAVPLAAQPQARPQQSPGPRPPAGSVRPATLDTGVADAAADMMPRFLMPPSIGASGALDSHEFLGSL